MRTGVDKAYTRCHMYGGDLLMGSSQQLQPEQDWLQMGAG